VLPRTAWLVIDRFDLRKDGSYRGFEDFCVLNARGTDEKYRGSYETSVMRRFGRFANSTHVNQDMEKLFAPIALNAPPKMAPIGVFSARLISTGGTNVVFHFHEKQKALLSKGTI
jgi:hypothetical protein